MPLTLLHLSGLLPECKHLNDTYRNLQLDKAELFNCHFYNQFSEASSYDINIDRGMNMILTETFLNLKIATYLLL
jgi:hypothetical protein